MKKQISRSFAGCTTTTQFHEALKRVFCFREKTFQIGLNEWNAFRENERRFRDIIEERNTLFSEKVSLNIWNEGYALHFILRHLRDRIKGPDTFYFFSKKFNPIWHLMCEGIDIQNSSTEGKLTWFIHIIFLLKTVFFQRFNDEIHPTGFILLNFQGILNERALVDHLFIQRFCKSDDDLSA